MTTLAFIDTETTGLDPDQHEIWEVGLLLYTADAKTRLARRHWFLPVDLGRADPRALEIGGFYDRYDEDETTSRHKFAREFSALTRGAHLVGNVVSFDEERLRKLLRTHGQCPGWHYHPIDLEPMVVGYLHGFDRAAGETDHVTPLPWKSDDLSRAIGVEPPHEGQRHTALGDARWAYEMYRKVVGA